MKNILGLLALLFISNLTNSCGTTKTVEAVKPEESEDTPMVYKNKTSFIAMPV